MSKKPTVLMILDGYGLNERHDANAVYEANTPVMDKLMAEYPFVKGNASGLAVGLPRKRIGWYTGSPRSSIINFFRLSNSLSLLNFSPS